MIYLRESMFDDLDIDDLDDDTIQAERDLELQKSLDRIKKSGKSLFLAKLKEIVNKNDKRFKNIIEYAVKNVQFSLLDCLYDYIDYPNNIEANLSDVLWEACTGQNSIDNNSNYVDKSFLTNIADSLVPYLIDEVETSPFAVLTRLDSDLFFETLYDTYSKLLSGDQKIVMTYDMTSYMPMLIEHFWEQCDYINYVVVMQNYMQRAKDRVPKNIVPGTRNGGFTIDVLFKYIAFAYGFAKIICTAIVKDLVKMFDFKMPEVVVKMRLLEGLTYDNNIDMSNINLIGYYRNFPKSDFISLRKVFNYIKTLQDEGLISFGNLRIKWDEQCSEATDILANVKFGYLKTYNSELEERPCMLWIDSMSKSEANLDLMLDIIEWIKRWMTSESKEYIKNAGGIAYARYFLKRGPESIKQLAELNDILANKFPDLFSPIRFMQQEKDEKEKLAYQEKMQAEKNIMEHLLLSNNRINYLRESMFDDLDIDELSDEEIEAERDLELQRSLKNIVKNDMPIFWQALMSEEGKRIFDDIFPEHNMYDTPRRGLIAEHDKIGTATPIFLDDLEQYWIEGKDNCMQLQVFLKSIFEQLMNIMLKGSSNNIIHYDYILDDRNPCFGNNFEDFINNLIDVDYFSQITNEKFLYEVVSRMLKIFVLKKLIDKDKADKYLKTINWTESKILISFSFDTNVLNWMYFDCAEKDYTTYFEDLDRFVKIMSEKSKYFDFSNFILPEGDYIKYPQLHISTKEILIPVESYRKDKESTLLYNRIKSYANALSFLAKANNIKTGLIVVNRIKLNIKPEEFDAIEEKLSSEFSNVVILLFRTLKDYDSFEEDSEWGM